MKLNKRNPMQRSSHRANHNNNNNNNNNSNADEKSSAAAALRKDHHHHHASNTKASSCSNGSKKPSTSSSQASRRQRVFSSLRSLSQSSWDAVVTHTLKPLSCTVLWHKRACWHALALFVLMTVMTVTFLWRWSPEHYALPTSLSDTFEYTMTAPALHSAKNKMSSSAAAAAAAAALPYAKENRPRLHYNDTNRGRIPGIDDPRPVFVFHIGPPKTATTSFQYALTHYRSHLTKDGYQYLGQIMWDETNMWKHTHGDILTILKDRRCVTRLELYRRKTQIRDTTKQVELQQWEVQQKALLQQQAAAFRRNNALLPVEAFPPADKLVFPNRRLQQIDESATTLNTTTTRTNKNATAAMARDTVEPDCWGRLRRLLQQHVQHNQSIILSEENFAIKYTELYSVGRFDSVNWQALADLLEEVGFRPLIVIGYRRLAEIMPSAKQQWDRWTKTQRALNDWPNFNDGAVVRMGRMLQPLFPEVLNDTRLYDDYEYHRIPGTIQWSYTDHLLKYIAPHLPVRLFDMHDTSAPSIRTNIICHVLPFAPAACAQSQHDDVAFNTVERYNPEESLFYDRLACAAAEWGWLKNYTRQFRHNVTLATRAYFEDQLGLHAMRDLPLTCPPREQLQILLERSLAKEEKLWPADLVQAWRTEHIAAFEQAVASHKYCWIDVNRTFTEQESRWKPFFTSLPVPTDEEIREYRNSMRLRPVRAQQMTSNNNIRNNPGIGGSQRRAEIMQPGGNPQRPAGAGAAVGQTLG